MRPPRLDRPGERGDLGHAGTGALVVEREQPAADLSARRMLAGQRQQEPQVPAVGQLLCDGLELPAGLVVAVAAARCCGRGKEPGQQTWGAASVGAPQVAMRFQPKTDYEWPGPCNWTPRPGPQWAFGSLVQV
jgi:hypothetical protein